MSFTWGDVQMDLFDHPYNDTIHNERAVEIPAAQWFLAGRLGNGLEVGNVLSHYGVAKPRRIVDLHERGEGVENIDVFSIEGHFDWIVSISTLEHVHWDDEQDPVAGYEAIEHLRDLLEADGVLFLSIPLGWNPTLDAAIKERWFRPITEALYAFNEGEWDQVPAGTWAPYNVGAHRANVVWIAELGPSLAEEDPGT